MLKWLRTLPDHSYTDERMEEIQSKPDDNSSKLHTKPDAITTADPADKSCSPIGSSDTKLVTKGGEADRNEEVGISEDLSEVIKQEK